MIRKIGISGFILVVLGMLCILQIIWSYRVDLPRTDAGFVLHFAIPTGVTIIFAAAAFLFPKEWRDGFAIGGISACAAILLGEAYLQVSPVAVNPDEEKQPTSETAAFETQREAILQAGGRAYPHLCPNAARLLLSADKPFAFGGIANNRIFNRLPGGDYSETTTDRFGFNNPNSVWDQSDKPKALIVGDSFTFGADLPFGEGFVDRARMLSTDWDVVNLGCGGNGPLAELGGMQTFVGQVKPDVIIWAYFEGNDLTKDILGELNDPRLRRYLENGALVGQDLVSRQSEIDGRYISLVSRPPIMKSEGPILSQPWSWRRFLTLTTLRTRLGLTLHTERVALHAFSEAIAKAKQIADSRKSRLIFLYLPAEQRYLNSLAGWMADAYKIEVLEIVERNGIEVVDVSEHFAAEKEPRDLYTGHFNAQGAEIAGRALSEALRGLQN